MISKSLYGKLPDGKEIYEYSISKGNVTASIINYGAIVTKLLVNDRNGNPVDVVLGRASLEEYINNAGYIGAAIGRHANRIAKGEFEINGVRYQAGVNENTNSLHGGITGFDQKIWMVEEIPKENAILLKYISADGEEGFPGTLDTCIKYSVTDDDALRIEYSAKSDKDTVCNLTNHSYFNLNGHEDGKIDGHTLRINADFYTPNDNEGMPTGEVLSVNGTPFDFRTAKQIGRDIADKAEQIQMFGGFDHNFAICGFGFREAAVVSGDKSGITMNVITNQPAMQLYTANMLPEGVHKGSKSYGTHDAFCLETQVFPNAMAHSHFPGPILRAGQKYSHITEYKFTTGGKV